MLGQYRCPGCVNGFFLYRYEKLGHRIPRSRMARIIALLGAIKNGSYILVVQVIHIILHLHSYVIIHPKLVNSEGCLDIKVPSYQYHYKDQTVLSI